MKSKKSKKKFNLKQKIKRLNKRGFTLVELLAIIVITAVVLGIGTYSVIKLVDNSKNGALTISVNSIKESASVYSDEDSSRWIEPYNDDYSYFCTTIGELINKGIIKKNATLPNGIDRDKYVSIKKNKVTLVKGSPIILNDSGTSEDEAAYKVCTGNDIKTESVTAPELGACVSKTDRLTVSFTDGDDDGIKDKWCQYDTTSTIYDGKNVIVLDKDATSCNIDNLKNNNTYYVRVCKTTVGGERRCDTSNYSTAEFKNITFSYSGNNATIKYDDDKVVEPSHYFKSNISAKSTTSVYECDDSFSCDGTTTTISKDKWYKTLDDKVIVDYSKSDGIENGVITARIADGSNNSKEFKDEFSLYKIVFKVGSADSIDNMTGDISKRCIAKRGKNCNITSPSIKKDCYTGMGWSTSNNANSSSWSPGASKSISSSGTYYPTNGNKTTYTVRYDANGGSGAPSNQTKTCKVDLTLRSTKPSRSNYTFEGWSSSSNGSVSYYPGGIYKNDKNITLYAIWEKEKVNYVYGIYYQANGSNVTGLPSAQYKDPGVAITLSSNRPSRSGYTFKGWSTSSSGGVEYSPGDKYYNDQSIYLYAVWSSNSSGGSSGGGSSYVYGIYYQANGSNVTGLPSTQYKDPGVAITLSSNRPSRSGYTFKGWSTSSSGGVEYSPGDKYYNDQSVYMYAVWSSNSSGGSSGGGNNTPRSYQIAYDANGGSGAPSDQTVYYGDVVYLSSTIPTRSGYTFKGWGSSKYGSATYSPGERYYGDKAITLYAIWEANSSSTKTYTITYYPNGNNVTGLPSSQTKEHDKTVTLSSTKPTRPTYKFLGWNENKNASNAQFVAGETVSAFANRNLNLYAIWEDPTTNTNYDNINGYRCDSGNKYYITTCTSSTCNYTKKNGSSSSGTVPRNTLSVCSTKTVYVSAKSGLNCRSTYSTSGTLKATYSCGTKLTVESIMYSGWYYATVDSCYVSSDYVSTTNPSCSSSSGGSCKKTVTCLGSATGYEACKEAVSKAGGTYKRNNPYGDCYGYFCNSCPNSNWKLTNE